MILAVHDRIIMECGLSYVSLKFFFFFYQQKDKYIKSRGSSQKYTGSGQKEPTNQKNTKAKKLPTTQPG